MGSGLLAFHRASMMASVGKWCLRLWSTCTIAGRIAPETRFRSGAMLAISSASASSPYGIAFFMIGY